MQKPTGKCNIDWREEKEGLLTALMRFTCCSSEVLQLFMTEIVGALRVCIFTVTRANTEIFLENEKKMCPGFDSWTWHSLTFSLLWKMLNFNGAF